VSEGLAETWRAARPPVAGLHLDSAACSRQSFAVVDAAARHARHEAEVGGYVAADAAKPVLDAGRAAVAALAGMPDAEVVFTTGSLHALDLLLSSWPPGSRELACLPGEYGPNLAVMAAHGFARRPLPTDGEGRVVVEEAAAGLAGDPPDLVHLTAVASHRGVVQPLRQMSQLCAELGLPLIVDAAQALGQIDCAAGADVTYASSRKWIAGPRGVGVLAVRPTLIQRLRPRLPPPEWVSSLSVAQRLELGEANVAARVGFSVALGEHVAFGPAAVRARLAEVGRLSRTVLADVRRWRVVESADEHSAITTLAPVDGADPAKVRAWLIAERRILTTAAGVERAPLELTGPVLRISPHVDTTLDDLTTFAEALTDATAAI
jgi:pyridoxal 5-phosphate dependent beta-lyase